MVVCYTMIVLFHTVLHHDGVIYLVINQCFRPVDGAVLHHDMLVRTVLHLNGVIYFVLHQCFRPVDGAVLHHDSVSSYCSTP